LAKGGFHSRTFDQGAIQSSSFAMRDQKAPGSFAASWRNVSFFKWVLFRKAAEGGYCSLSFSRLSIVALETTMDVPREPTPCPADRWP